VADGGIEIEFPENGVFGNFEGGRPFRLERVFCATSLNACTHTTSVVVAGRLHKMAECRDENKIASNRKGRATS
jgi:hypothetical protein